MSKDLVANVSGLISLILGIWAAVPYFFSIIQGRTKPHQLTWLVFSIMNGIILLSQYLKGGRASLLLYAVWFVSSLANFVLSLKYGVRNTSRWDQLLFGLSLVTIVAWILTKNPSVAIWLTLLIDVFATTMILLKIKAHPDSEAPGPWTIATVAYVFTIISLANKAFGILYLRPIYGLFSEGLVVVGIYYFGRNKLKTNAKSEIAPLI